jgi:lipoprotein NlpI
MTPLSKLLPRLVLALGVLFTSAFTVAPVAAGAPSQEELQQLAQQKRQALTGRIERLTREIGSGRLLGKDLAEAYRWRGVTLSQLEQHDRALDDFSNAIQNDLTNPQYYEDRAIAYLKLRRFAEANQDLDMALGLDNKRPAAHREKGRLAAYQRNFEQAARHFLQAMQNERNMGVAYNSMWLHIALQRGAVSGESGLEALADAFPPDQWPAPVMRVLVGTGTPEAAIAAAAAPDPESYLKLQCEAQFYAGEHYLIKGDAAAARAAFEAVVATNVTEFLEWDWARRELELMARP